MTAQRKNMLIWLLLPLLVLRGLVPAGFMIDATGNGLSMVVCTGGMHHMAMSEQQGDSVPGDSHDPQKHATAVCPFAAATFAATMPGALLIMLDAVSTGGAVVSYVADFHSPFGPSRAQQSRAPPTFS